MLTGYVLLFCRIVIALVFIFSATGKLRDVAAFQAAVSDFQILPAKWNKAAAWLFLGAEILVVGLMLLGGNGLLIGFFLAAALLAVFSYALLNALQRKKALICNCFGATEQRISPYDVARNIALIACSLLGIWTVVRSFQYSFSVESIVVGLMAVSFTLIVTNLAGTVATLRQPVDVFLN